MGQMHNKKRKSAWHCYFELFRSINLDTVSHPGIIKSTHVQGESGAGWTSGYVGPPLIFFYCSRSIILPIDTEETSSGKLFNQKVSWRLHDVHELHVMFSHFKHKK